MPPRAASDKCPAAGGGAPTVRGLLGCQQLAPRGTAPCAAGTINRGLPGPLKQEKVMRKLLCVAALAVAACTSPAEPKKSGTVTKVEFMTCATAGTILSEKGVCYVVDVQTLESKLVVQLCAGVNVTAGNVVLSGGTKAFLCSTVEFPLGTKKEDAIREAESLLAASLKTDRQLMKDLEKKLGLAEAPKAFATFRVREDAEMAKKLKKALGEGR